MELINLDGNVQRIDLPSTHEIKRIEVPDEAYRGQKSLDVDYITKDEAPNVASSTRYNLPYAGIDSNETVQSEEPLPRTLANSSIPSVGTESVAMTKSEMNLMNRIAKLTKSEINYPEGPYDPNYEKETGINPEKEIYNQPNAARKRQEKALKDWKDYKSEGGYLKMSLTDRIDNMISKAGQHRVYLKLGEEPPYGYKKLVGEKGAPYYVARTYDEIKQEKPSRGPRGGEAGVDELKKKLETQYKDLKIKQVPGTKTFQYSMGIKNKEGKVETITGKGTIEEIERDLQDDIRIKTQGRSSIQGKQTSKVPSGLPTEKQEHKTPKSFQHKSLSDKINKMLMKLRDTGYDFSDSELHDDDRETDSGWCENCGAEHNVPINKFRGSQIEPPYQEPEFDSCPSCNKGALRFSQDRPKEWESDVDYDTLLPEHQAEVNALPDPQNDINNWHRKKLFADENYANQYKPKNPQNMIQSFDDPNKDRILSDWQKRQWEKAQKPKTPEATEIPEATDSPYHESTIPVEPEYGDLGLDKMAKSLIDKINHIGKQEDFEPDWDQMYDAQHEKENPSWKTAKKKIYDPDLDVHANMEDKVIDDNVEKLERGRVPYRTSAQRHGQAMRDAGKPYRGGYTHEEIKQGLNKPHIEFADEETNRRLNNVDKAASNTGPMPKLNPGLQAAMNAQYNDLNKNTRPAPKFKVKEGLNAPPKPETPSINPGSIMSKADPHQKVTNKVISGADKMIGENKDIIGRTNKLLNRFKGIQSNLDTAKRRVDLVERADKQIARNNETRKSLTHGGMTGDVAHRMSQNQITGNENLTPDQKANLPPVGWTKAAWENAKRANTEISRKEFGGTDSGAAMTPTFGGGRESRKALRDKLNKLIGIIDKGWPPSDEEIESEMDFVRQDQYPRRYEWRPDAANIDIREDAMLNLENQHNEDIANPNVEKTETLFNEYNKIGADAVRATSPIANAGPMISAFMGKSVDIVHRALPGMGIDPEIAKANSELPQDLPEYNDRYEYGNNGVVQLKPEFAIDAAEYQMDDRVPYVVPTNIQRTNLDKAKENPNFRVNTKREDATLKNPIPSPGELPSEHQAGRTVPKHIEPDPGEFYQDSLDSRIEKMQEKYATKKYSVKKIKGA